MSTIGEALRKARIDRGLSQDQVAEKARINRSYLSEAEHGANISIDVLERLVIALEIEQLPIAGRTVSLLTPAEFREMIDVETIDSLVNDVESAVGRLGSIW